MPFLRDIQHAQSRLAIWENDEDVSSLLKLYKPNEEEQSAINSIKLDKRKKEYLITRMLCQHLLGQKVVIEKEENGKPVLKELSQTISISHADRYSVVMISEDLESGVDIEVVQERILRLTDKFASAYEKLYFTANREELHFTILWCLKEAVYKWYAKGGVDFKQNIMAHPFTAEDEGEVFFEFLMNGKRQVMKANFTTIEDHVLVYLAASVWLD